MGGVLVDYKFDVELRVDVVVVKSCVILYYICGGRINRIKWVMVLLCSGWLYDNLRIILNLLGYVLGCKY